MTGIFKKKKFITKRKKQHKNGEAVINLITTAPLYWLALGRLQNKISEI